METTTVETTEGNQQDDSAIDDGILREARARFDSARTAEVEARLLAIEDIRFVNDEDGQWTAEAKESREKRPCMTFDQVGGALDQVVGDFLQNRPGMKVRPIDSGSDPEIADIYTGIIRNIEGALGAQSAYKNGFKYAATGGYGVWRVVSEYNDDDSFDQDLKIKKVKNPFSVLFDPAAQETTKHDGNFAFVYDALNKTEFEAQHPDATFESIGDCPEGLNYENWFDDDSVVVAEYWRKVPTKKQICLLSTGDVVYKDEVDMESIQAAGIQVVKEREADSHKIEWFKLTASQILERAEIPGRFIRLIPCYGKVIDIEGETKYRGLVRKAKDPQRSYNYHRSQTIETIALQPKAPWLYTPAMVAGHETKWSKANTANVAGLPYNADPSAPGGRPSREAPPAFPAALAQEGMTAKDDIKAATGIFDASLGAQGNENSGKAILARQQQGDTANYEFTDNFIESIELTGRILVDLIPTYYDTERVVRILGEDEAEDFAMINQTVMGPNGPVKINDLSIGKYDIKVSTGPSYVTRRNETAEQLTQVMQTNPQAGELLLDLWVDSLDLVGADEAKKRIRKVMIQKGIAEPTKDEQEAMGPPPPPDPMEEIVKQLQVQDLAATVGKKQADAEKSRADAENKQIESAIKQVQAAEQVGNQQAFNMAVMQLLQALQPEQMQPQQIPQQPELLQQ